MDPEGNCGRALEMVHPAEIQTSPTLSLFEYVIHRTSIQTPTSHGRLWSNRKYQGSTSRGRRVHHYQHLGHGVPKSTSLVHPLVVVLAVSLGGLLVLVAWASTSSA